MKASASPAHSRPETQLAGCIDKFSPQMARAIRAVRAALRKRLPAANELVYDNYNFFVIGYSPTLRPSHTIAALVADGHGVRLAFYWGSKLPDPAGILKGDGTQNRFLPLEGAKDLARPEVEALMAAAIAQSKAPLAQAGRGSLIIRSISPRQRPRRLAAKPTRR